MELKEKMLSSFMALEQELDLSSPVHDIRSTSLKTFEILGFPTKKDEAWKYTSLAKLLKNDYSIFPKKESSLELKDVKKYFLYEIDSYKVVFIDGIYSPFLSDTTHDGIDVCLLSAALSKPKYKEVIEKYFNKVAAKDESLTALNTSFAKEGAYVFVPKSVIAEKPIQIIHFSTGEQGDFYCSHARWLLLKKMRRFKLLNATKV